MFPFFSDYIIVIVILLITILLVLIAVLYNLYYNYRRQDKKWKVVAANKLAIIQSNTRLNVENKIIALDKLLEYIFQHYFGQYSSSLSDILRKQVKSFSDIELDGIWLSRKIVDELISPNQYGGNQINLENTINIYTKYIRKYIR